MKKNTLFIMACVWLSTNLYAAKVTITGTTATITEATAGCLSSSLTAKQKGMITKLIVSGAIDPTDFKTMKMEMNSLTTIDISGVSISEYKGPNGTSQHYVDHPNYNKDEIPDNAFNSRVKSVSLPNHLLSIGSYAFGTCSNLTTISIPNSVTSFGACSFDRCSSLTAITIPPSVTNMGRYTFLDCRNLKTVTIQSQVTSIGDHLFWGCKSLANLTIPGSVKYIEEGAFSECTSLKTLTIPNSVESIGKYAFNGCTSLMAITIPPSVKSIGSGAFQDCKSINKIVIPELVTCIENYIFKGCTSLASVQMPYYLVTSIGTKAFQGCTSLASFNIPYYVTSIGSNAFQGCTSLTSVRILNPVTAINDSTFANCSKLVNAYIVNGVKEIGKYAFYKSGLEKIDIPGSVLHIKDYAFAGCSKLNIMKLNNGTKEIAEGAFQETPLNEITIPNSVTDIGSYAFYHCGKKKSKYEKNSVSKINIPGSVSVILAGTFDDTNCEVLILGDGIKSIESNAFEEVSFIYSYSISPPILGEGFKFSINFGFPSGIIIVPDIAVSAYQNARYWGLGTWIDSMEHGTLNGIPWSEWFGDYYKAPAFKDNTTTAANSTLENAALSLSQNENGILAINGISKEGNGVLTVFKNENGGITINGINPAGGGTVTVRDMGGRVLQTTTITGTSTTFNRKFGAGIYLVTVNTQGNTITKKVVL